MTSKLLHKISSSDLLDTVGMQFAKSHPLIVCTVECLAIALAYFALGRAGQFAAIEPGNVTPVWPASGFALAVVLWRGHRIWPGLWLGVVLANTWAFLELSTFGDAIRTVATGIAIGPGAICQAFLGAYLVRRFCASHHTPFGRTRDVFRFVGTQSTACLLSATFGMLALCVGGVVPWSACSYTWLTWYLGDTVGVILVAPVLLTWPMILPVLRDAQRMAEAATILMLSMLVSLIAFTDVSDLPFSFLPLPLVLWAAVRGDQFAVSATVLVPSTVAIWATVSGQGAFMSDDFSLSLMFLQFYMSVTLVTGLAVAAALDERRRAEQAMKESEARVRAIVETAVDGIITIDARGIIDTCNPAVEKIFGYSKEELIGGNVSLLMPSPEREQHDGYLARYAQTRQRKIIGAGREVRGRRKDGTVFPLDLSVSDGQLGSRLFFTGIVRDVTLRHLQLRTEKELAATHEKLRLARIIQQRYFPTTSPVISGFDLSGASYPAEETGGDYFDYFPVSEGRVGIVVADVTGHGIGPALVMSQTRAYLRALLPLGLNVSELVTRLNDFLAEDSPDDLFVTLFLAQLDPHDGSFVYASAGHQCFLFGPGDESQPLESTGMPLGILPGRVPSACPRKLQPGQLVLFLTDGVLETLSPQGDTFGIARTLDVIRANRHRPAGDIVKALYCKIRSFSKGTPQLDDITAVILKTEAYSQPGGSEGAGI